MGVPLTLNQVPSTTPYIQYISGSGQTVFDYPFPITQDSDLVVVVNGVTLDTDAGYTVSGQGDNTGGFITFTVGQTAGAIITLFRDIEIERITQIGQNSGFSSVTFNAEFNNIYLIMQQLEASLAQCLQVPNTNNPAPVTTLSPGAYANKYLSFDANGNPVPAVLTTSGTVTQALIGGLLYPALVTETGVTNTYYPYYNVLRYGADPTGANPSRVAFNNCFASAMAVSPHAAIYIPAGTYQIEHPGISWATQTDIRVYGDGPNQSVLVAAGLPNYVVMTISADIGNKTTGLNCNVANFGIKNGGIAGVGGLFLADYLGGSVRDIAIQASGNGLTLAGMADIDIINVSSLTWQSNAAGNTALLLGADSGGQVSGPLRFSCCEFNGQSAVTVGAALSSTGPGGLGVAVTSFSNCQFIGIGAGLVSVVELPGGEDVTFIECYSESSVNTTGNTGAMFRLGQSGTLGVNFTLIGGHFFTGDGTHNMQYGIQAVTVGQLTVMNTTFANFATAAMKFQSGMSGQSSLAVINSQQLGNANTFFDASTSGVFPTGSFVRQWFAPTLGSTGWGTPTNALGIANFPGASATLVQCSEVIAELILQLQKVNILAP